MDIRLGVSKASWTPTVPCFCEESVCTGGGRVQPNTDNIHTKVGVGFDIGMFGLML